MNTEKEKLVLLNIVEHSYPYGDEPCNSTLLLKTKYPTTSRKRTLNAFKKYIKTQGYKTIDDAMEEGIFFGNSFQDIPIEIQQKYGFHIKNCTILEADFDLIWNLEK